MESEGQPVKVTGAILSPEARKYLRKALRALDAGLLVNAWHWTEKARAELDELTEGAS